MTEKRFTLAYENGSWWAVKDGDITLWKEEVVGLLNELATKCSKLEKETEQLKLQLQNTSAQRDEFYRGARENANRVGKLKKENEHLKKELKQRERMLDFRDKMIADVQKAVNGDFE